MEQGAAIKGQNIAVPTPVSDNKNPNKNEMPNPSTKKARAARMRAKREFLASMRKKAQCKIECPSPEARVSSRDVPNHLIQDRSKPMVIVGTDVVGLYPNLT